MYVILKYSSSSKLKPTFFPEIGNAMSYVIIVVSLNGVDVRSISRMNYEYYLQDIDKGVRNLGFYFIL